MKRHRWVRTEILPGLGMRVEFKFGTTSENASFTLTYSQGQCIIGYAEYRSPRLTTTIRRAMPISDRTTPDRANKVIWAVLTDLEKEGRATE